MGKVRAGINILGITGSLGAGKSTALSFFQEKGFHTISSDAIAREFTEKGTPVSQELKTLFGPSIFDQEGNLDRARLAALVFPNPIQLEKLQTLLHPLVRGEFLKRIQELQTPRFVAWEVPLLFETDAHTLCDKTLCLALDPEESWERVKKRGGISKEDFQNRLQKQMPLSEKTNKADLVVWNRGTKSELIQELETIANQVLEEKI